MFARKAAIALRDKKRQEHIHTLFTSPKDVNTLVKLGKLYFEDKKYHFALDLLERAKRSGHNEAATWKICGDCHVEIWKERPLVSKKHLLYALSCYRKALKSIIFVKPSFWSRHDVARCMILSELSQCYHKSYKIFPAFKIFIALHIELL